MGFTAPSGMEYLENAFMKNRQKEESDMKYYSTRDKPLSAWTQRRPSRWA